MTSAFDDGADLPDTDTPGQVWDASALILLAAADPAAREMASMVIEDHTARIHVGALSHLLALDHIRADLHAAKAAGSPVAAAAARRARDLLDALMTLSFVMFGPLDQATLAHTAALAERYGTTAEVAQAVLLTIRKGCQLVTAAPAEVLKLREVLDPSRVRDVTNLLSEG